MIVGTAGHIDHGKTTLVQALTGVDTDRLPEEKKRGISIELGYAFMNVPDQDEIIGFIDVPGHERLVHTMLAGATGIDFALLLIAADDGVMPQTREHLAVLSLLGMARGAVVLTKVDRVDEARLQAVRDQAAALVQGSALADAPVLAVSAHAGQGVEALRALLWREAGQPADTVQAAGKAFRLAVDRVFSLPGAGTVATGTIHAGRVQVGDMLTLAPGMHTVRVRSLHAQNRAVTQAVAGQRCAVALAGLDKAHVHRGQWLCAAPVALATHRLDARLTLWQAETRPLASGTRVQVHLGAASVPGTVAVLDADAAGGHSLQSGAAARVQILLHQALGAWHGDRVVLRDASASRTVAGGVVLDPFAPARYRRTPQRLRKLDALGQTSAGQRLAHLLAAAPHGVDVLRFAVAEGLEAAPDMPADALLARDGGQCQALAAVHLPHAHDAVLAALAAFHEQQPDELGPDAARLRRLALPRFTPVLWQALLQHMQRQGALVLHGAFVHLPAHGVQLSATENRIAQETLPGIAQASFEGAWVRDLAALAGEPEALVRTTLARLARRGELHQVVKDLYYRADQMAQLAQLARQVAQQHAGEVLAAAYRDATGLGRKRAIQILEYLDRIGVLRRAGDAHRPRTDSTLFIDDT